MIEEVQYYRPSFAHLLVWLTFLTLPFYFLIHFLIYQEHFNWKFTFDTYQLLAAVNMLGSFGIVLGIQVRLLPRGLTAITPTLRTQYVPYSGILDAQSINLIGLRFIRVKNEAEQVFFIPMFLGKQREFLILLDGLLPEKHVVRDCFETPKAYAE